LAKTRAYILATISSKGVEDVAVTLDVSRLGLSAASMAWLCEVPHRHVCCMPITGYWTSYMDKGVITYYRGDLSRALRYSMHLLRPPVHDYLQETESAFAVLLDGDGISVSCNTLYFSDLDDETEQKSVVTYMGPGAVGMTKIC
jgi:hypothetical protein